MKRKGLLFVISGPSGCGKTTLGEEIISGNKNLVRSVSVTTRPPRRGERRGKAYFFVNDKEFMELKKRNKLLEWAKVFGYFYGTPREFVVRKISQGKDVVLIIDVQGAMQVKKKFPHAVFIFIAPPSLQALRERLKKRGLDSSSEIEKRLRQAKKEMEFKREYNYILINDDLDVAKKILNAIITLERLNKK
ncbi:MAG: guanylate kinase [Candidatus Omnitrophica bacterium]|nr:guanylate kinase [Candidatus Omnitrophota bacterium]